MGPDTVVRTSKPGDRDAIIEVVLAAFSSADHDGHNEVDIVLSSWATGVTPFDLELVAVDDGAIRPLAKGSASAALSCASSCAEPKQQRSP